MSADKTQGLGFMPFMVDFDLISGIMRKPDTQLVRLASSMRGHYADAKALEDLIAKGDPIHYEVFEKTVPQGYGHLQIGISKTYPGTVGGECFMTKGHYHKVAETGGDLPRPSRRGLHADEASRRARARWSGSCPGNMVYVPPFWGHRSVNTGDEPLVTLLLPRGGGAQLRGHREGRLPRARVQAGGEDRDRPEHEEVETWGRSLSRRGPSRRTGDPALEL